MVLQYKVPTGRWFDYRGKKHLRYPISEYEFRLLSKDRTKVLAQGSYKKVLERLKEIEYYKRMKD